MMHTNAQSLSLLLSILGIAFFERGICQPITCQNNYASSSGNLTSPNFPRNYSNNANTCWTISQRNGYSGGFFTLKFLNFSTQLDHDFVEVRLGSNSSGALLGLYSGSDIPSPISIPSYNGPQNVGQFWVGFTSDESVTSRGFWLTWSISRAGCGQASDYSSYTGTLSSNYFPSSSRPDDACVWTIKQPPGFAALSLIFNIFDTVLGQDIVEIRDGTNNTGRLIGKYSGRTIPDPVVVTSGELWVMYTVDVGNKVGFTAAWNALTSLCDTNDTSVGTTTPQDNVSVSTRNTNDTSVSTTTPQDSVSRCGLESYESMSGDLTSPEHPCNYGNNEQCVWTITQPDPNYTLMTLRFTFFSTQENLDIVELREVDSGGALIGRFSGSYQLYPAVVGTAEVWVNFTSDGSVTKPGFRLTWNSSNSSCGETNLTSLSGTITSPNYPGNYSNDDACIWTITMPEGFGRITLNFTNFVTELNSDFVEVTRDSMVTRHSGSLYPFVVTTSASIMKVIFSSDNERTAAGFGAQYSIHTTNTCGNFTDYAGTISSPNYPNKYLNQNECEWQINRPDGYSGYSTRIRFTSFDIEAGQDFLEIHEGTGSSGKLLGLFSGNSLPPELQTASPQVWIKFTAGSGPPRSGFTGAWDLTYIGNPWQPCVEYLYNPYGEFISPNFPNDYYINRDCVWYFSSPWNQGILLTFTEFNTEESFDIVEVREGQYGSGKLLAHLTGSSNDSIIINSTSSEIYITFHSDYSFTYKGFRATYFANYTGSAARLAPRNEVQTGVTFFLSSLAPVLIGLYIHV